MKDYEGLEPCGALGKLGDEFAEHLIIRCTPSRGGIPLGECREPEKSASHVFANDDVIECEWVRCTGLVDERIQETER